MHFTGYKKYETFLLVIVRLSRTIANTPVMNWTIKCAKTRTCSSKVKSLCFVMGNFDITSVLHFSFPVCTVISNRYHVILIKN